MLAGPLGTGNTLAGVFFFRILFCLDGSVFVDDAALELDVRP
jgi:hypothetical protein